MIHSSVNICKSCDRCSTNFEWCIMLCWVLKTGHKTRWKIKSNQKLNDWCKKHIILKLKKKKTGVSQIKETVGSEGQAEHHMSYSSFYTIASLPMHDALAWNSGLVVLVPTNYLSELYLQAQLAEIALFIFWHVMYGFELESLCPLFPLLSVVGLRSMYCGISGRWFLWIYGLTIKTTTSKF